MRLPLVLAIVTVFATNAPAAPSPVPAPGVESGAIARPSAIDLGPAGATREADYFRAPRPRDGVWRIFPCRYRLRSAQRSRALVQACD
jgi:hypothetical protein